MISSEMKLLNCLRFYELHLAMRYVPYGTRIRDLYNIATEWSEYIAESLASELFIDFKDCDVKDKKPSP